jgi:bacteriorhodopsin
VTFIAAYHYFRIFNSWNEAYEYNAEGVLTPTGRPFNDAYRYMDWLLTVPLLLIEVILVMNLGAEESRSQCITLGTAAALMIILGYPGELILEEANLSTRWLYWFLAMLPFLYIVYTLLIGLASATDSESDPTVRGLIKQAQWATVISWCTYPVVYIFPMIGFSGSEAVVFIQIGYSISDIIAKCGVGLLIYSITMAKSHAIKAGGEETPLYGSKGN